MESYTSLRTVSHHLLRRRARLRCKALQANVGTIGAPAGTHYYVEKAKRGPFRYRVVAARRTGEIREI